MGILDPFQPRYASRDYCYTTLYATVLYEKVSAYFLLRSAYLHRHIVGIATYTRYPPTSKHSQCARRLPATPATRPHGGAVVNTSPASWTTLPKSNGAHAHPESNNKAHNILPWAHYLRHDYRRG